MRIEKANELFESGDYSILYKEGLLSAKAFEYREIFLFVDARMKAQKISKNKAVEEAEIRFDRGRRYIYRALKTFKV